jgi:flagella basal body P-ring formation protein FlgA
MSDTPEPDNTYSPFNTRRLWIAYGIAIGVLWLGLAIIVVFFTEWTNEPVVFAEETIPTWTPIPPTPTETIMTEQVVARVSVPAGTELTADMLTLQAVPLTLSVREGYNDIDKLVGKTTRFQINEEQIITRPLIEQPPLVPDLKATATEEASTNPPTLTPDPYVYIPPDATPSPFPMMEVVVPRYDIPAGTILTESDILLQTYPRSAAPGFVMRDLDDAIGYATRTDLPANYPILRNVIVIADHPDAFTGVVLPTMPLDACLYINDTIPFLFDSPTQMAPFNSIGTVRPNTNFIVVDIFDDVDGEVYQLEMASGYRLGWVRATAGGELSGNCDKIQ